MDTVDCTFRPKGTPEKAQRPDEVDCTFTPEKTDPPDPGKTGGSKKPDSTARNKA